jgi:hypothetical protein
VIVVVIVLAVAAAGAAVGLRHLYLRFDRPGGMTCSLRVARGEQVGLGPKFHAGWAGPQMRDLLWRRLAWPGPGVVFPLTAIRIDRERPPRRNELWRVPASFSILPVELEDGVVLELAVPRHGLRKLVGLIGGGPPAGPSRRGR